MVSCYCIASNTQDGCVEPEGPLGLGESLFQLDEASESVSSCCLNTPWEILTLSRWDGIIHTEISFFPGKDVHTSHHYNVEAIVLEPGRDMALRIKTKIPYLQHT